jgi:Protein of function (DUF2518)
MPSTSDFWTYTQWSALLGLFFAVAMGVSFLFKWGWRFRLVGATGFMIVLTVGLFGLSLVPFTTVYDSGSTMATIVVAPTVTGDELRATLEQAASDLFSPGRLGRGREEMVIRARTVVHVKEGLSEPVYLGEARRSISEGEGSPLRVRVDEEKLARAARASEAAKEAAKVAKAAMEAG